MGSRLRALIGASLAAAAWAHASSPAHAQPTGAILLPEACGTNAPATPPAAGPGCGPNDGTVVNIAGGGAISGPRFATGLSWPLAVCQGPGGDIYVLESNYDFYDGSQGDGELTIITGGGNFTGAQPIVTGLSTPFGLYCTDDAIYVAENTANRVVEVYQGGACNQSNPCDASALPTLGSSVTAAADVIEDGGVFLVTRFDQGVYAATGPSAGTEVVDQGVSNPGSLGLELHDFGAGPQLLVALWNTGSVLNIEGVSTYLLATTVTTPAIPPMNLLSIGTNNLLISAWDDGDPDGGTVYRYTTGGGLTVYATGVFPYDVADMTVIGQECGNSFTEGSEECDDGNDNDNDLCRNSCQAARCGDGALCSAGACSTLPNGVEACDDGNAVATDSCLPTCQFNVCGDGITNILIEECDDGNDDNTDGCIDGCLVAACGDGFVQEGIEECDDSNDDDDDACVSCAQAVCGDGFIYFGVEECDDQNDNDSDDCRNDCTLPFCGNGTVDPLEQCDDGNVSNQDPCLNDCMIAVCGDGIIDLTSEECDDGNTEDNDTCTAECLTSFCGDGVARGEEQCDDANESDNDACLNDCTLAFCGDGIIQYGVEDCDDGNTDDGDECTATCRVAFDLVGCGSASSGEGVARSLPLALFLIALALLRRRRDRL